MNYPKSLIWTMVLGNCSLRYNIFKLNTVISFTFSEKN